MSDVQSDTSRNEPSPTKNEDSQVAGVEQSNGPKRYKPGEKWQEQEVHEIPYKWVCSSTKFRVPTKVLAFQ